MGTKKVYLHIGTAKTGTTSIQRFLADNSERLATDYGIAFPLAGRQRFRGAGKVSSAHHRLALGYYRNRNEDAPAAVRDGITRLVAEIEGSDATTFVVSSEYFPGASEQQILDLYIGPLSKVAEVHTIVYLRRQDQLMESMYAQAVKRRPTAPPRPADAYRRLSRSGIFDFFELAEIWGGRVLGRDRVHVRPYERPQLKDGDSITDFMSLIGVDDIDGFTRRESESNPSLTRDQLLIIRAMHEAGLTDKLTKGMRDPFRGIDSNDTRYVTSPARRQNLIDEFAASNERVAREYMGREDGVIFTAPLPHELKPRWTPKREPELRFVLRAAAQMADDATAEARSELSRVKKQLSKTEARLNALEERLAAPDSV